MQTHPNAVELAAAFALAIAWILFGAVFLVGRNGAAPAGRTTLRGDKSRLGFILHMAGYALVFAFERPRLAPIFPMSPPAEALLFFVATIIGLASVYLCFVAARTLDKQWSLVARIVSDHELIQRGPYALVRHPIYLGMFGLLIQTGIVLTYWWALVPAAVLFVVGTRVRIAAEEQILRRQFGGMFDEYARNVPSFIPRVWPHRLSS